MHPQRGQLLAYIRLQCRVRPLQRPRLFSSARFDERVYQPLENQKELREKLGELEATWIRESVFVDCFMQFQRSKRLQFPSTQQFGDLDNNVKAVYDGLQAANFLMDDSQIVGGEAIKFFGPEDAVEIKIFAAILPDAASVAA